MKECSKRKSMNVNSTVRVVMLPQQRGCMRQADAAGAVTIHHSTVENAGSQRNGAIR